MMNEIAARRAIRQFEQNNPNGRFLVQEIGTAVRGDVIALGRILTAVSGYLATNQDGQRQPWERQPAQWQREKEPTKPSAGRIVFDGMTGAAKWAARWLL